VAYEGTPETGLMPSSYADSFPPIVHAIIAFEAQRVLDIGPGWGKYGLACREYLPQLTMLDAIEVPQGRLRTQPAIYDNVFIGDARDAPEQFYRPYNLALLIDIIEHLTLSDGHRILSRIQRAGPAVLVATPKRFIEQHADRNPHEEHLSFWDEAEFAPHSIAVDASTDDAGIYILKGRQ
jgi:hypothetical protein